MSGSNWFGFINIFKGSWLALSNIWYLSGKMLWNIADFLKICNEVVFMKYSAYAKDFRVALILTSMFLSLY